MSATGRVLVVDDEPGLLAALNTALTRSGHQVTTAETAEAALDGFQPNAFDLVVTDLRLPGIDGLDLMRRLHAQTPELPVIVITAHGDVRNAVEAMTSGAFHYLSKPFDNDELRSLVSRGLKFTQLQRENRTLREALADRVAPDGVVAESDASKAVLALVRRVAPTRASVLIQGPTGTGKEVVARLLHAWSDRACGPFVAVNCKALHGGVLESELFGHERGAFTGAGAAHAGCFERADGGTLFLDEIGEVSTDFQAKLLRVLQEGEVQRVGGERTRSVDVRVVAATNRVLSDEIEAGRFREDLFFRLNVIPVELAPLRERKADIVPLAERFLTRFASELGRSLVLSSAARDALLQQDWPGNVRELQNVIERASILADGPSIEPDHLILSPAGPSAAAAASSGTLQATLDAAAEATIRQAMDRYASRQEAAAALGIERTTLYRWIKRLGLE